MNIYICIDIYIHKMCLKIYNIFSMSNYLKQRLNSEKHIASDEK